MKNEPKFYTTRELSLALDGVISEKTLRNWRYLGTGPVWTKIGGRVVYPRSSVEAYLSAEAKTELKLR